MSLPNRSTKLKVAFGYILLTALLFISIGYIYQEMKSLSGTGDDEAILSQRRHVTNQIIGQLYQAEVIGQSLSTGQIEQYYRYQRAMKQATTALDSLRTLLTDSIQLARLDTVGMLFMDKERNMRNLLKAIQDGGTDILYKQHIDELIAQQDSLLSLPHVRKKVITHTNSYIIRKKPKSFFKRLGEVFSPGKADSTQVNNVIQEEYTDTLTEAYSPADTVVTMLKNIQSRVTDTQQERMEMVNRRTQSLRLSGLKLSQKVNQLLSTIEEEEQALAQNKHIQEEYIRQSSIRTVAGIAIVAVVLAIFFLVLIWRDITRSNHYRRELEKAKRRAEDLLAAREKLMLTITHDIKAPVGSILGYTDLLERITTEERQRFYLNNMQSSANHKHIQEEYIRQSSIRTVAGIAIVAVVLAIFFLVLIWRDITRSNHYRRELEKAKRRAEDLLAAREKLMLTITHDIKAPVGSILGYTDLLERITTEERQRFYLNNMQSSANHLLSLVKSLLDYHRLDAHKMDVNQVSFNPHQLFDTIYISFKPMADSKQLELNYHCNESLNRVYIGDPFRIRQIAENLLSNALKFTKEGGITLRAALENGQLHFSISDTGCGISQEEQQRIFQEFTRLHNAQGQEGFGLGLAITRKLVLLLEGDIKIESEQGKGSRFHVYLPLPEGPSHPDENPSGPEAEHTPASPDATGIRQIDTPRKDSEPIHLILIDDDRIQLQLTTAMLERPGVTVTCCHHPEELLNKLKDKRFDALLTDIQMPAMNGFDLLKAIRTLDTSWVQTLPVIALTARSDMDENYFCSHGFAGCLHKPFTINELFTAIFQATGKDVSAAGNPAPHTAPAKENHPQQETLDFSALTAFSEDDPEAAAEILRTFISETKKNREYMEEALAKRNMEGITAIAHKLLPLFTMLGATRCIPALTWMEQRRGTAEISEEAVEKTNFIVKEIEKVIDEAQKQIEIPDEE